MIPVPENDVALAMRSIKQTMRENGRAESSVAFFVLPWSSNRLKSENDVVQMILEEVLTPKGPIIRNEVIFLRSEKD